MKVAGLCSAEPALTADMLADLGMPVASVYRILERLTHRGLVRVERPIALPGCPPGRGHPGPYCGVALDSSSTVAAWVTVTSSKTPSEPITMPANNNPCMSTLYVRSTAVETSSVIPVR